MWGTRMQVDDPEAPTPLTTWPRPVGQRGLLQACTSGPPTASWTGEGCVTTMGTVTDHPEQFSSQTSPWRGGGWRLWGPR